MYEACFLAESHDHSIELNLGFGREPAVRADSRPSQTGCVQKPPRGAQIPQLSLQRLPATNATRRGAA
jgi:hypothetical protein